LGVILLMFVNNCDRSACCSLFTSTPGCTARTNLLIRSLNSASRCLRVEDN
jgi:hypothetical protein